MAMAATTSDAEDKGELLGAAVAATSATHALGAAATTAPSADDAASRFAAEGASWHTSATLLFAVFTLSIFVFTLSSLLQQPCLEFGITISHMKDILEGCFGALGMNIIRLHPTSCIVCL